MVQKFALTDGNTGTYVRRSCRGAGATPSPAPCAEEELNSRAMSTRYIDLVIRETPRRRMCSSVGREVRVRDEQELAGDAFGDGHVGVPGFSERQPLSDRNRQAARLHGLHHVPEDPGVRLPEH